MGHRFLHIGIHFTEGVLTTALEGAMHSISDDWIRYASNCWIIWTDKTPAYCATALRPHLPTQQFVIFPLDHTEEVSGFAQQWVWDWIKRPRPPTLPPLSNYAGLLASPPGPPGALRPRTQSIPYLPPLPTKKP